MNKVIKIIFFTIFIDLLGYGILIPVIPELFVNQQSPFYVLAQSANPKIGLIILGLLLAVFPLGQFFATPILGQLSDRYGRKKILIISILGTAFSYFLFAIGIITKNIPLLFFSRFFDGLTGGNIAVAQAAITDVTLPENRAKNFGMIGAAFGLGFIFGPFLGGKLSDPTLVSWFNPATPFYFAGILALLNVISILLFLPETHKNIQVVKIAFNRSIRNIITAFSQPKIKKLYISSFFFNAGFAFFTTFFSVFLILKFNFTQGQIGNFFAYVGLWSVITQAIVTRALAKKFTGEQILTVALLGSACMLLVYLFPRNNFELYLIPPLFSFCTGLIMANLPALISARAGKEIQGEVLGINASVTALAQSIPAILSGFIAALVSPTTPLLIASFFVFIAWAIFLKAKKVQQ
jgi:DHA1 family tetracycline resistance protein-like MFS transporter